MLYYKRLMHSHNKTMSYHRAKQRKEVSGMDYEVKDHNPNRTVYVELSVYGDEELARALQERIMMEELRRRAGGKKLMEYRIKSHAECPKQDMCRSARTDRNCGNRQRKLPEAFHRLRHTAKR